MTTYLLGTISFILLASAGLGCGRHRDVHALSPTPPPGLEIRAGEVARDASSDQGGAPVEDAVLFGMAYQEDETRDFEVRLDNKHCYWFGGAGDSAVEQLSLYLWDPHEKSIAKERSSRSTVMLATCPAETGRYHLRGKVSHGFGHYAIAIYAAAKTEPVATPSPAVATIESLIEDQAKAVVGAERVGNFYEGTGEKTDWFAKLDAGNCYWIISAGEPNAVKKVSLYLWSPKDSRIKENYGENNTAVLGHCATETGMYRFETKVTSGSGRYKAAVYRSKG